MLSSKDNIEEQHFSASIQRISSLYSSDPHDTAQRIKFACLLSSAATCQGFRAWGVYKFNIWKGLAVCAKLCVPSKLVCGHQWCAVSWGRVAFALAAHVMLLSPSNLHVCSAVLLREWDLLRREWCIPEMRKVGSENRAFNPKWTNLHLHSTCWCKTVSNPGPNSSLKATMWNKHQTTVS